MDNWRRFYVMVIVGFTEICTRAACEFKSQLLLEKPEHGGDLYYRSLNYFQLDPFNQSLQHVKEDLRKEFYEIYDTLLKNLATHYRKFYLFHTTKKPSLTTENSSTTDRLFVLFCAETSINECLQSCLSEAIAKLEVSQE